MIVQDTKIITIQSINDNAVVSKIPWRNGVYITAICSNNDSEMAINKNLFEIFLKFISDLQLNTLKIWNMTKTVNAIDVAFKAPAPLMSS